MMSQSMVHWIDSLAETTEVPHLFLTLAALGLSSHQFFVRYNDVDRLVGKCFVPFCFFQAVVWGWLIMRENGLVPATIFLMIGNTSFFAPLFFSISVYRVLFHPLNRFPGPPLARLTSWWGVFQIARGANKYQLHHELHKQYGDVVRIGMNALLNGTRHSFLISFFSTKFRVRQPIGRSCKDLRGRY